MAGKLFAKHIVRKIFLEDWAMKLTALVITFGLWFGVTGLSTPTTKRLTVPLNLSISNNTEVTNVPQPDVEIVISGDKRKIDQINKSELIAMLDLTDVAPGDRVVSLSPENVYVQLPQGIKLVEIQPGRIPINLEAVEEKEIEVKVNAEGSPAAGYEVYSASVLPPKIRVRGPASFIKTVNFVETGVIDISGKTAEFTAKQIPVSVSNPKASVLNTVVDVYWRIGEKRVERSFSVPVSGSPGKTATFTLYGPRTLLSKTRSDAFKIDLADEAAPQLTLSAELQDLVEIRRLTVK
ncbi:MAG: CdaR family protein [Pyrinomonadaceae bacterium]